jgi:hypothetical protein
VGVIKSGIICAFTDQTPDALHEPRGPPGGRRVIALLVGDEGPLAFHPAADNFCVIGRFVDAELGAPVAEAMVWVA